MHSPLKKPLLRMLRWVSVAPFGETGGAAAELELDRVGFSWPLLGSMTAGVATRDQARGSASAQARRRSAPPSIHTTVCK
jgi:hypothetical protein